MKWDPNEYDGVDKFFVHDGDENDIWKPDLSVSNTCVYIYHQPDIVDLTTLKCNVHFNRKSVVCVKLGNILWWFVQLFVCVISILHGVQKYFIYKYAGGEMYGGREEVPGCPIAKQLPQAR